LLQATGLQALNAAINSIAKDIDGDIEHLIEAGHISPQASKKSAKTKDTDTAKD
jgi:hypothetical protein